MTDHLTLIMDLPPSQGKGSSLGPQYSGLNMKDILTVTLAREMAVLGMDSNKPLDLTHRGMNLSKKNK